MDMGEQMKALQELKKDDGQEEEDTILLIQPFMFSFQLRTDYEVFCAELIDNRNLKVCASFEEQQ